MGSAFPKLAMSPTFRAGLLAFLGCVRLSAGVRTLEAAHLASDGTAEEWHALGRYDKCPGTGCLICKEKSFGYTLEPDPDVQDKVHYRLTISDGQQISLVLPKFSHFNNGAGKKNCFAFATHQLYQTPAGSPTLVGEYGLSPVTAPADVTEENFMEAMRREEAIFLGRETSDLAQLKQLPVVEGRSYYLVAAFLTPREEYHFWGLWNNGWYCVSSKISAVPQDMGHFSEAKDLCPTGSMWKLMKAKNVKYSKKLGGYFLFPCRGEEC